ncbi:hypothetical protein Tco_1472273 [Tanacetum coccineum]
MVVMIYQKSYSFQLTMIHVLKVEIGSQSTFLGAKGLTSPRVNGCLNDYFNPHGAQDEALSLKLELKQVKFKFKEGLLGILYS